MSRAHIILGFVLALGACSDETTATTIKLDVSYRAELALDELRVQAHDNSADVAPAHTVQVVVPDEWAGEPLALSLDAMSAGVAIAHGDTSVTPIAGSEARGSVTLTEACVGDDCADPDSCTDECTSGTTRCATGNTIQVCGATSGGCLHWLTPADCLSGTECDANTCETAGCTTSCNETPAAACVGASTLRTFGAGACTAGSCTYAPTDTSCPYGCAAGACQPMPPTTTITPMVAVGNDTSCSLNAAGTITCWGANDAQNSAHPPSGTFASIDLGRSAYWTAYSVGACALSTTGVATCWGHFGSSIQPPSGTLLKSISVGAENACGVRLDGTIGCWGGNSLGQSNAPSGTFTTVSAGRYHACALAASGIATCWGDSNTGATNVPAGVTFTQISAGYDATCGIKTDKTLQCWGTGDALQNGVSAGQYVAVTMGRSLVCAINTSGALACGIFNGGSGNVPSGTFSSVSAGGKHECAMRTNGTVACWGDNGVGQTTVP